MTNRLNIAQVGYGYWGPNISRNITASPKTSLHVICDTNENSLSRAKANYGDKVLYSKDYKGFLEDKGIDAFAVSTSTEASYQIAIDILNAGKHLFIEKPMAINTELASNICNLAKEKGLIVHCDHIMIFHPIIKYIKKMYDSGELGELIYFDVSRVNLGPIRADINAMLDLAVHDLAVLDHLSEGKEPIEVDAIGEKRYGSQETLAYLTMRYPGFLAHIKASWLSPLKERRLIIGGTKKLLVFDDVKMVDKLAIYDHGIIQRDTEYGDYEFKVRTGDMVAPYIPHEDALKNSVEHFADCVFANTSSIAGADQALRVVKILDRALKSMKEGVRE